MEKIVDKTKVFRAGDIRIDLMAKIEDFLKTAGIEINGNNPWDIQVHNPKLYQRLISQGSLGFGEAYMDKWWSCQRLDELIFRILSSSNDFNLKLNLNIYVWLLISKIINLQSKNRAFQVGERHYDLGNTLFELMLDKRMVYSCAYWKGAKTLDQAQEDKMELICRKLKLEPGMKVLDIGCGWGSFAVYASEKYGVEVVGITISKEQLKFGEKYCKNLPVELRLQDYREIDEKFNRVVSVGMLEHVGYKNYKTFMEVAHRCLKDDGLLLLQTIGNNESTTTTDPFINKYIFPNGMIPSIKQLGGALEGLFVLEDLHNLSVDYDKTLMAWYKNFDKNWEKIKAKYGHRFYRMWTYYLLSCAGSFRARRSQLWQIVLSKKGIIGGYEPER